MSTLKKTASRPAPISKAPPCRISCASRTESACTLGIFPVIQRRTVAFACRNSWRRTSLNRSLLGLRLRLRTEEEPRRWRVESRRIELSELDADSGGVPQLFNIVLGAIDPPSLNV